MIRRIPILALLLAACAGRAAGAPGFSGDTGRSAASADAAWTEYSLTWSDDAVPLSFFGQVVDGVEWYFTMAGGKATVGDPLLGAPAIPPSATGRIAVPPVLGGCPIAGIADGAFDGCSALTSVVVPESVETIGGAAFRGCSGLEELLLPSRFADLVGGLELPEDCEVAFSGSVAETVPLAETDSVGSSASRRAVSSAAVSSVASVDLHGPTGSDETLGTAALRDAAKDGDDGAKSVYRFYSKNYKGHFFTIDEGEKENLVWTNPNWKYEGVAYRAFENAKEGTTPLYRFYSKNYKGHFFTINEGEKENLIWTNPNWKYEGVAYHVYASEVSGSVPVYRFWSKNYRHHFFTVDEQEMRTIRLTNPNWNYEGVAFWALPSAGGGGSSTSTYTIRFNANGGSGWMADQGFSFNVAQTLRANAFTRRDYTFAGWATSADGPVVYSNQQSVSNLATANGEVVTLYAVWQAMYMVVDLSGGPSATSYPVTYRAKPPSGGFNTDEYKTTKLVLRRLEPGPIPTRDATITKHFYVGLFEVTQRQWELVMGTRPSYFRNDLYYSTRPMDHASYDRIRGSSLGSQWPASNAVDADSFLGKLRARTGQDFDLPTEAQWEYACRAGTTTDFNNGRNLTTCWERKTGHEDSAMNEVGRYAYNGGEHPSGAEHTIWADLNYYTPFGYCTTEWGTAAVGSYRPNAWGLYDMHGNVTEWCLDGGNGHLMFDNNDYDEGLAPLSGNDPVGLSITNSVRVMRGGCWGTYADFCTSSYRGDHGPSSWGEFYPDSVGCNGFRLVRPLSE